MVRFINAESGGEMWVHETRVEEYLARGHRIADEGIAALWKPVENKKAATKKKTAKKG